MLPTAIFPAPRSIRTSASVAGALLALTACTENPIQVPDAQLGAVPPLLANNALGGAAGEIVAGSYIVQLAPTVKDIAGMAKQLTALHGGSLKHTYTAALRGFAVERIPDAAAAALRRNPNVILVEADRVIRADGSQNPTPSWGLDRIDQASATFNGTYNYPNVGAGVTAYIVDTGIRFDHTDFQTSATDTRRRTLFGYDAFADGQQGNDCHGHGTHVAGTVGGLSYGVAKQATLVAVRVLDCNGSGYTSGVVAALNWMIGDHAAGVPAVANMSLSGGLSSSLNTAVAAAIADGIVMAVAAGNSNANACNYSPASTPDAITVGASGTTDAKASFSNYGDCVDLFAPGVSIVSAVHSSTTASASYSGTSMASPHVAGAAALYLAANPTATPTQVRDFLVNSATQRTVSSALSKNNHLLNVTSIGGGSTPPPPPSGNVAPIANFTYSCSSQTCTFTDKSTDSDGSIAARTWSFGNGATSTATSASVTYTSWGSFTVQLTVTDNAGATSTTSQVVTLVAPAPTTPDVVVLSGVARARGTNRVDLSWKGSTASRIDVYRNGVRVTTVSNTGAYSDAVGKTRGTYSHTVCNAGTTVCSNSVTTVF